MDQWEREVQLYIGLRQLPVFRQHRLSKALSGWRRAVGGAKAAKARAALAGGAALGGAHGGGGGGGGGGSAGLFALSPAFQEPLRRVWGLCCDVAALRLHALKAGQVRPRRPLGACPTCLDAACPCWWQRHKTAARITGFG
jgi:dynein heavy chain